MPEPLDRPSLPWLTERARRDPAATALCCAGRTLTYAELADNVELVAARLVALGVGRGDRVAAVMDPSLRLVELVHAAQRCAAALVPIHTRLAVPEVASLLERAEPCVLLHDREHAPSIEAARARVGRAAIVEAHAELDALAPAPLPAPAAIDPGAVHTILFTSGTTGRPKGAMLTNGNHLASAVASRANLGVVADDRWLLLLPLYHVGGLSIVLRGVLDGVPVVLHPRFDPADVARAIGEEGITLTSMVATMLLRLLEHLRDAPLTPSRLRCVLLGGGPVPEALVRRALALGVPVAPTYGLTEASSQVATAAVGEAAVRPRSAGRPLPGTRLEIACADRLGRGEILVQGPTVMAGYLGDPAATAAAIRDGWLHTGDIGHLEGGHLHVDDRRTDLILSGGENVYPREVEAVLLAHPDVREAAVYAVADREWGQSVTAAVVPRPSRVPSVEELRTWCRARLAGYKVPRQIALVAALPRTASGKLQRHRLRGG